MALKDYHLQWPPEKGWGTHWWFLIIRKPTFYIESACLYFWYFLFSQTFLFHWWFFFSLISICRPRLKCLLNSYIMVENQLKTFPGQKNPALHVWEFYKNIALKHFHRRYLLDFENKTSLYFDEKAWINIYFDHLSRSVYINIW